jgi:hypothetical protein
VEQFKDNTAVKRAEQQRQLERERLRRTPARELARQIRAKQFFHWHAGQHYVECSNNGKREFRLTVKNPPRADGNGRKADKLFHPRDPSSLRTRVERIMEDRRNAWQRAYTIAEASK